MLAEHGLRCLMGFKVLKAMQILKTLASNFAGEETLTNEAVEEGGKERRKTGK